MQISVQISVPQLANDTPRSPDCSTQRLPRLWKTRFIAGICEEAEGTLPRNTLTGEVPRRAR